MGLWHNCATYTDNRITNIIAQLQTQIYFNTQENTNINLKYIIYFKQNTNSLYSAILRSFLKILCCHICHLWLPKFHLLALNSPLLSVPRGLRQNFPFNYSSSLYFLHHYGVLVCLPSIFPIFFSSTSGSRVYNILFLSPCPILVLPDYSSSCGRCDPTASSFMFPQFSINQFFL